MISSKVFERWLISITDMPTPGSASISLCASSRTGSGITAGPALKLKIRSVMIVFLLCPTNFSLSLQLEQKREQRQTEVCRTTIHSFLTAKGFPQHCAGYSHHHRSWRQTLSLDHY